MTKIPFILLLAFALGACTAIADEMLEPIRPTVTATATQTPTEAPRKQTTPIPTPEPSCTVETGMSGGGWLNIREHPTEKSRILATVPDGTELTIITPGAWLKVRREALTGYVNATFCPEK